MTSSEFEERHQFWQRKVFFLITTLYELHSILEHTLQCVVLLYPISWLFDIVDDVCMTGDINTTNLVESCCRLHSDKSEHLFLFVCSL